MNTKTESRRSLHKYVIGGVGIWFLFVLSLPIAYFRVSQMTTFEGSPFKGMAETETHKPIESYASLSQKKSN